jgi:hypothetical protein
VRHEDVIYITRRGCEHDEVDGNAGGAGGRVSSFTSPSTALREPTRSRS